jgi:hypothetical protein
MVDVEPPWYQELGRLRELSKIWGQSLNRRAEVEQMMFDAASGKRSMPTAEELREWALRLGVPDVFKEAVR